MQVGTHSKAPLRLVLAVLQEHSTTKASRRVVLHVQLVLFTMTHNPPSWICIHNQLVKLLFFVQANSEEILQTMTSALESLKMDTILKKETQRNPGVDFLEKDMYLGRLLQIDGKGGP